MNIYERDANLIVAGSHSCLHKLSLLGKDYICVSNLSLASCHSDNWMIEHCTSTCVSFVQPYAGTPGVNTVSLYSLMRDTVFVCVIFV